MDDYPSGTYNLSIREMMDGIPIYVDVGDRLSLDLASDKGKKGVNDFWRKNVKLWRVRDNYFEFMNKSRFELDTAWLKRVNKIEEDVLCIQIMLIYWRRIVRIKDYLFKIIEV